MQIRDVVVLAGDEALLERTAVGLSRSGCRVRTRANCGFAGADLILRDWRYEPALDDPGIPVVTLDLSLVQGRDLRAVLQRVLGPDPDSFSSALSALLMILRGHSRKREPRQASGPWRPGPGSQSQRKIGAFTIAVVPRGGHGGVEERTGAGGCCMAPRQWASPACRPVYDQSIFQA